MNDWVPASGRTKAYVVFVSALLMGAGVTGHLSTRVNDTLYLVCHVLLFILLVVSFGVTLWSARQCHNPRLRLGWTLVAAGQITSMTTSLFMIVMSSLPSHPSFDGAAPMLTVAFLMVAGGLAVAATSVGGQGERRKPFLYAAALAIFMFLVMLGALLGPGPTMPFSVGPRDYVAVMRLAIDIGLILMVCTYATLLQLRLRDGHKARSWMWAAASALVAAMGDVGSPLVDLGLGQIYPELLWCLGDVLLAVAASLAADFDLAEQRVSAEEVSAVVNPATHIECAVESAIGIAEARLPVSGWHR
jgi:uncharacterized membrane protein YhaH (DUF805 family)